jgi:ferric-dicitrate binding protein FerR (iron transport regulator)
MSAGDQVKIDPSSVKPVVHKADLQVATAWTRREVIFNGESLAEVTAQINRYLAVPIRIEDDALNRMRVRAVFNAYDSDSFIAFLRQYGVEVRVAPDAIHVSRN